MRLLCVNQFVPPDVAPTAVLLGGLRNLLSPHGWQVDFLGAGKAYRKGGRGGWRRWLRDLSAHFRLLWRGVFAGRPEMILCLTDPPGLVFTASLLARFWKVPLVHWVMDVYPEVASALGEVNTSGALHRVVTRAMEKGYARCGLIICLDADMAEKLKLRQDPRLLLCPPWPPHDLPLPASLPPSQEPEKRRLRWIYSGNLGRAHDYETMLRAQQLLERDGQPFDLVIQGGGQAREPAIKLAAELQLQHCLWHDYVDQDGLVASLLEADILIASQRPAMRGLLWPSKLAVMRLLPRPVAWIGAPDGAVAQFLRDESASPPGIFAPGDSQGLAAWLCQQAVIKDAGDPAPWDPAAVRASLEREVRERGDVWHARLNALIPSAREALPQPA